MSTKAQQIREEKVPTGESDLPEGWCISDIGELTINHDGQRIPLKSDTRAARKGTYPYFGASGIIDSIDDYIFDGHFLLIAEDGANLLSRSTPLAFQARGRFWVNNHAHVVQLRDKIPLSYLELFLNSVRIDDFVTGSAQPKLTQAALNRLPVPVAPISEQQRIVHKIQNILASAERAEKPLAKTRLIVKRFRQAVLAAACSGKLTEGWRIEHPDAEKFDLLSELKKAPLVRGRREESETLVSIAELPALPETWQWVPLCSLSSRIGDVDHKMPKAANQGIPYISTKDFCGEDEINYEEAKHISLEDYRLLCRKITPEPGDLLFSRYGTIGEVRLVDYHRSFQCSYSVAIIKTHKLDQLNRYLLIALKSLSLTGQVENAIRASSQPDLGLKHIRGFLIPVPPLEEQIEIIRRVEALFKLANAIQNRIGAASLRAERLTQAVLAKAFRGELVPTEAELARREGREYEPASVLLQRIKAEREAAEPRPKRSFGRRVSKRGMSKSIF